MSRSLLDQLVQIRHSGTYDDSVADVNNSNVAEPTVSGSLQEDMNVVRTLMKDIKGTSYWYSDLGSYFDPTDTDAGDAANKTLNLSNISGNTLDSKTVIIAVTDNNSGSYYTVSGTSTGILFSPTSLAYADPANRVGLPIFSSTTNSGSYYDEGGSDNVCRIDIIDADTEAEMQDGSGYTVYAKFHDGADHSGTGENTDVFAKFYANGVECDLSTVSPAPSSIYFIYPYRRRMSDMQEYEWLRTDFVSSWEGDIELIEDITNLWSFTGASDNTTDPTWTNTAANYLLDGNPDDLMEAINDVNDGVGNLTYTSTYLSSGQTVTASLNALGLGIESNDSDISSINSDISGIDSSIISLQSQISSNDSDIAANASDIDDLEAAAGTSTGLAGLVYSSTNYVTNGTSLETAIGALDAAIGGTSGVKYVETTAGAITANVEHALPYSITYTPDATAGQEGNNMDVYLSGQLLAADTGAAGANADRDYGETTTSGITFRFDIPAGRNITYVVRQ